LTILHATKANGNGGMPPIFNTGTRHGWVTSSGHGRLIRWTELGWSHSRPGHLGDDKNPCPPPRFEKRFLSCLTRC